MIAPLDGPVPDRWAAPDSSEPTAPSRRAREGPARFEQLVRGLFRDIDHGEALAARAEHPGVGPMDAGTLIALQAGIYRYTEALDLTVKLVDRATSAAKTVLESGR